jgi:hypothetical protein
MLAKLEIVLAQGSKLPIAIQTALREFIGNNLQQVCCEQISLKWADRWRLNYLKANPKSINKFIASSLPCVTKTPGVDVKGGDTSIAVSED